VTDMDGALEPCGCTSRPLGGIDRLAARLSDLRAEVPSLMFVVGNTFVGPEHTDQPAFAAQTRLNEQTLGSILQVMEVSAVAPGPSDLRWGAEELRELSQQSDLRVLPSDDAEHAQAQTPSASASMQIGELNVGVFAISSLEPADPPVDAARRLVLELKRAGAQIVVGLVSSSSRATRRIARLQGVDLVIRGGLDRAEALPPSQEGGALVVHGGRQGQGLLVIDLYRRGDGAFENASAWSRRARAEQLRREARSLARQIAGWERAGDTAAEDLQRQRQRLTDLGARADAAERPGEHIPAQGNVVSARLVELPPEAPRDPAIRRLLEAHDRRVGQANRRVWADITPPPAPEGEARYVGAEACGACHAEALRWWSTTPHGRAYQTLEAAQKQFDLDCVGCHVTGYRRPGGSNVTHVGDLAGVGCEVCHGPGSLHVSAPERQRLSASPEATVCLRCHTQAHSDLFDFDAYRAMLVVPGHGRREP